MEDGLFGFLKQVALFIKLVKLYSLQKYFKTLLSKPALNLPSKEHFHY